MGRITRFTIKPFGIRLYFKSIKNTNNGKKDEMSEETFDLQEPRSELYSLLSNFNNDPINLDTVWANWHHSISQRKWKKNCLIYYDFVDKTYRYISRKVASKKRKADNIEQTQDTDKFGEWRGRSDSQRMKLR